MKQTEIWTIDDYQGVRQWIEENGICSLFLVGGKALQTLAALNVNIEETGIRVVRFDEYQPNPQYSSVAEGVIRFRQENCDGIMAVGGGSAIDVAKCVKLYSNMEGNGEKGRFLKQKIVPNQIPFLAIPTTAGTGTEATRYAVIYYEGEKQSICHESCIPQTVVFSVEAVRGLPEYHKKAAMLDALSHALESFWSVNSTEESKTYSRQAIRGILENMEEYGKNTDAGISGMLRAANFAGKAINITQTTAGHAMCYKLTSMLGYAHGHAAFLCNLVVFRNLIEKTHCAGMKGDIYLAEVLKDISISMGCKKPEEALDKMKAIFRKMNLAVPALTETQIEELVSSVNEVRLKNHPVKLMSEEIRGMYCEMRLL